MKVIRKADIQNYDLIFVEGTSSMAEQIKKAQRQKGNIYWQMNHVGIAVILNETLCVAEEDYPGRFDINPFFEEYEKEQTSIYVGRVKNKQLDVEQSDALFIDILNRAAQDKLTNYAYLDILSFKLNAVIYKLTKKDVWIGRRKNRRDRYTCSQITAKYLQDYWGVMTAKNYLHYTPADIADSGEVEIFKLYY